ncbi:MAG: hypothetical protein AAF799_45335 [Myxococcota bacterium]
MDWDWHDPRRPGGISSLPDDDHVGDGSNTDGSGDDDGGGDGGGDGGSVALSDLAGDGPLESDPYSSSGSGSTGTGAGSSKEPESSPAVVAQAAALRSAAQAGSPFCEE